MEGEGKEKKKRGRGRRREGGRINKSIRRPQKHNTTLHHVIPLHVAVISESYYCGMNYEHISVNLFPEN